MSHQIYTTPSFVLSHGPWGEGNAVVTLYTRELGLVRAQGRSLREMRSKMRYHLQELSSPEVCLIKGRELFRLVGVNEPSRYKTVLQSPKKRRAMAQSLELVSRLVSGEEEPNENLFDDMDAAFSYLDDVKEGVEMGVFSATLALRILHHLGYLDPAERWSEVVDNNRWDNELLAPVEAVLPQANVVIRQALYDSHL